MTTTNRPAVRLGVLAVVAAFSIVFVPSGTEAAFCSHGVEQGRIGNWIEGLSSVSCTGMNVTYHYVKVQEKVGFYWWTRATESAWPNKAADQRFAGASCEGRGRDLWRSKGYYQDSLGGSGTKYAPSSSGGWHNC